MPQQQQHPCARGPMAAQQQLGPAPTPQQQQMMLMQQQQQQQQQMRQQQVQRQQAFDPWDNRVPNHLKGGGDVMSAAQGRVQRRGQGSSIVFG